MILQDSIRVERHARPVAQILEYLESNLKEHITLSDLSRLTYFSPGYLDAVFRREMGEPIISYLIRLRIERAKRLIMEGGRRFSDIAHEVGFDDPNYFTRCFKRLCGETPGAYQKKFMV